MTSPSGSDQEAEWILSWKMENLSSWDLRQTNRRVQAPGVSEIMCVHTFHTKYEIFQENGKEYSLINTYFSIQVEKQVFLLVLYLNWMNPKLF